MAATRLTNLVGGLLLLLCAAEFGSATKPHSQSPEIIPVEVFQIHQLPVTLSNVELIKSGNGYHLRCLVTNNSDEKLHGFRYSLIAVDSNQAKNVANRSEALGLTSYTSKRKTFRTPLTVNLKDNFRLVLMMEQIVGTDSIWEVVKAKDALDSYVSGDFSSVPVVLRVSNHVDVPPQKRVIY